MCDPFPKLELVRYISDHVWGGEEDIRKAEIEGELTIGFQGRTVMKYIKENNHLYKVVFRTCKDYTSRDQIAENDMVEVSRVMVYPPSGGYA